MTGVELGLVESSDKSNYPDSPSPGVSSLPGEEARSPGSRTYRFVTLRDRTVWLNIAWEGAPASTDALSAGKAIQRLEVRVQDGPPGQGRRAQHLAAEVAARLKSTSTRDS